MYLTKEQIVKKIEEENERIRKRNNIKNILKEVLKPSVWYAQKRYTQEISDDGHGGKVYKIIDTFAGLNIVIDVSYCDVVGKHYRDFRYEHEPIFELNDLDELYEHYLTFNKFKHNYKRFLDFNCLLGINHIEE